MKDVSPGGFNFLVNCSDFCLAETFNGLLVLVELFFNDFALTALGPFSRLLRTILAACSFVKQSQIPSHATTMKSCSGLRGTFFTSGNEET